MDSLRFLLLSLVCTTAAYGYSCHSGQNSYYHADVSTGCQVYHYCNNGEMVTLTCPSGQAFDQQTRVCKDSSSVDCVETDHHHRHKRSEEAVIHSISIDGVREGVKQLYTEVKELFKKSVKEIAPTVYDQINENYVPIIQEWKENLVPFYKEKVVPHLKKSYTYTKKLYMKLAEKVQQSWKMSNSTHIHLVSFADVAKEVSSDMEPVVKLGRYLSRRLARSKRQATRESKESSAFDKLRNCFNKMYYN